jgi:hypothetical protein
LATMILVRTWYLVLEGKKTIPKLIIETINTINNI